MEYRVVYNSDVWRVQRRRYRWWPWVSLKCFDWGHIVLREFTSYNDALTAKHDWRDADAKAARIRRHGWRAWGCQ